MIVFTLEEFLEKYPYKVGDEVTYYPLPVKKPVDAIIINMYWNGEDVLYITSNAHEVYAKDLQLYKEQETMSDKDFKDACIKAAQECLFGNDEEQKENNMENKGVNHVYDIDIISFDIAQRDEYELILCGKFEIKEKDGRCFVVRKKPKYPKSYDDCCEVLNECAWETPNTCYKGQLMLNLQKLLICRDAYWKIAGDWKPEFRFGKKKYCIMTKDNRVITATVEETNRILAFPTSEMRDAFYDNFKERINEVKELL